jgi:hypothetical protein
MDDKITMVVLPKELNTLIALNINYFIDLDRFDDLVGSKLIDWTY